MVWIVDWGTKYNLMKWYMWYLHIFSYSMLKDLSLFMYLCQNYICLAVPVLNHVSTFLVVFLYNYSTLWKIYLPVSSFINLLKYENSFINSNSIFPSAFPLFFIERSLVIIRTSPACTVEVSELVIGVGIGCGRRYSCRLTGSLVGRASVQLQFGVTNLLALQIRFKCWLLLLRSNWF